VTDYLLKITPYVSYVKDFIGENVYKKSTAIYYHAKELAAQGNVEAQKMVDDLKPLFEASLREQMGNN
jgi:hypothetical protein